MLRVVLVITLLVFLVLAAVPWRMEQRGVERGGRGGPEGGGTGATELAPAARSFLRSTRTAIDESGAIRTVEWRTARGATESIETLVARHRVAGSDPGSGPLELAAVPEATDASDVPESPGGVPYVRLVGRDADGVLHEALVVREPGTSLAEWVRECRVAHDGLVDVLGVVAPVSEAPDDE